jgi:hypothetical protein
MEDKRMTARTDKKSPYRSPTVVRLGSVAGTTFGNNVAFTDAVGNTSTFYGNPNKP